MTIVFKYLPIALLLLIIGVLIYAIVRAAQGPAAPFRYTQAEYQSERLVYAPGETMTYTAGLTIERSGAVELIRGWRTRPANGRARLCNGRNAPTIHEIPPPFPDMAIGREVEGRISVVVPALPPGDYWLVSAVFKPDGGETTTVVPLTITAPCDG